MNSTQGTRGRSGPIERFTGNRKKSIHDPRFIDELVDAINALKNMRVVSGSVGRLMVGDRDAVLVIPQLAIAAAASGNAAIKRFKITQIYDFDFFSARELGADGNMIGPEIQIAKFDDYRPGLTNTFTRNVDGVVLTFDWGGDNNVQVSDDDFGVDQCKVNPRFAIDNIVVAAKMEGSTGVVDFDGNPVVWLDLTPRELLANPP